MSVGIANDIQFIKKLQKNHKITNDMSLLKLDLQLQTMYSAIYYENPKVFI